MGLILLILALPILYIYYRFFGIKPPTGEVNAEFEEPPKLLTLVPQVLAMALVKSEGKLFNGFTGVPAINLTLKPKK